MSETTIEALVDQILDLPDEVQAELFERLIETRVDDLSNRPYDDDQHDPVSSSRS